MATAPTPTAVDLGLSVKWASMNIYATSQYDSGKYYAWGEVTEKSLYDWSNYMYCNKTADKPYNNLNKYTTDSRFVQPGIQPDLEMTLGISDDAANLDIGNGWRMPTKKEFQELIDNCKWEYIADASTGECGYKVTSKIADYTTNYIYLPMSGAKFNATDTTFLTNKAGYYWTKDKGPGFNAFILSFDRSSVVINDYPRQAGFTIRPVYDAG